MITIVPKIRCVTTMLPIDIQEGLKKLRLDHSAIFLEYTINTKPTITTTTAETISITKYLLQTIKYRHLTKV